MTAHSDDLVSLEELRSVLSSYAGPAEPRMRAARSRLRGFRPVLVVAVAVVAFVVAGVAIADQLGAFDGIGAAQHPRTRLDKIGRAVKAEILHGTEPVPIGLQFGTARRIGQLSGGQHVYVLARSGANDNLCYVIGSPGPQWSCSNTLSRRHPSTALVYTQGGKPWSTIGIALNGVTAVSFTAGGPERGGREIGGHEVTVPVKNNIWRYTSHDFLSLNQASWLLMAHFADGTTAVDRCPMC